MFEAIVLFAALIVLFVLVTFNASLRDSREQMRLQNRISFVKDKLKIAEKKFFTGKLKKNVFDSLLDELESELASCELSLFRLQKSKELSVEKKANALLSKVFHPSRYRKVKLSRLLLETELLNQEIDLLESKFMKRELRQGVFEKLLKEKEQIMLEKESEIVSSVRRMNE